MPCPKDPVMLLSYVNMKLRDEYKDLEAFCEGENVTEEEITEALKKIGYEYSATNHRFI